VSGVGQIGFLLPGGRGRGRIQEVKGDGGG
jgi:hypothetical protein